MRQREEQSFLRHILGNSRFHAGDPSSCRRERGSKSRARALRNEQPGARVRRKGGVGA